MLLNFPALAKELPDDALTNANINTQPLFSQLLVDILDYGKKHPGTPHTAQLLTHLNDHPLYERLVKLAAKTTLVPQQGALIELQAALHHRQLEALEEQIQQLLKKNQHAPLCAEEKSKLQRLISKKNHLKDLNINTL